MLMLVHRSLKSRLKCSFTSVNYAFSLDFASSEHRLYHFEIGSNQLAVNVNLNTLKSIFVIYCLLNLLSGCVASKQPLYLLESVDTGDGYYLSNSPSSRSDSMLLILSFSGGGTRAASLAYGVLQALEQTTVTIDGKTMTLLDEVDVITSVSGGSYTAAYYGLFGKRIFQDYESAFLKRNFQSDLYRLVLNPWNWSTLASSSFDRSDLIAQYLNTTLFQDATIGDLQRPDTPFIMINASETGFATQVAFEQRQFDMFCLDVSKIPVGVAVMASSAVPLAFTPITFENQTDRCENKLPRWARTALETGDRNSRRFYLAGKYKSFKDAKNFPYIHLYDGGLTDNLGLRSIINVVERQGGAWNALKIMGHENVRKAVVIVVDAKSSSAIDASLDKQIKFKDALNSALNVSINSLSFETISMMREIMSGWRNEITSSRCWEYARQNRDQTDCYVIDPYLIEVSFEQLESAQKSHQLVRIPTTFNLSGAQVDLIKASAAQILHNSPQFNKLLKDLNNSGL